MERRFFSLDFDVDVPGRWSLYTQEDEEPDWLGEYRFVAGPQIDEAKVGDTRVFRRWGYHIPIIVDGELKAVLERAGITGGRFEEV